MVINSRLQSDSSNNKVRVRFAPSPTGHLHIGSVRTALFNWLFARHSNGAFVVRIEDTDKARSKSEYTDSIIESLKWLSIEPDEPLVIQSEQTNRHKEVIEYLLKSGKAYKCYCVGTNYQEGAEYTQYDKTCRDLVNQEDNKPYVVRFKIPYINNTINNTVEFEDLIRGTITFDKDQLDDFIIMRSDGSPTYNFVVVVDDADMGITHVIRGEDHISNTPKQLLLYHACNFKVPYFAHLPLILGSGGQRLSKRDAATAVVDYKKNGFLPDALINYLVRLGWSYGDQEIFTRQELISSFSIEGVGKKASIFDMQKLEWVNSIYIKNSSAEDLYAYIDKNLKLNLGNQLKLQSQKTILMALDLYKDRVNTLEELIKEIDELYTSSYCFNKSDIEQWQNSNTRCYLDILQAALYQQEEFTVNALKSMVKNITQNLNIGLSEIAKPLRFALTGKMQSPGIYDLVVLLGKQESIKRLEYFRESIKA